MIIKTNIIIHNASNQQHIDTGYRVYYDIVIICIIHVAACARQREINREGVTAVIGNEILFFPNLFQTTKTIVVVY